MKIHNYDTELKELLDCPFCDGKPIAYLQGNEHTKKRSITIKCQKCLIKRTTGAITQSTEWLEKEAIQLWNNRVAPRPEAYETSERQQEEVRQQEQEKMSRWREAEEERIQYADKKTIHRRDNKKRIRISSCRSNNRTRSKSICPNRRRSRQRKMEQQ